VTKKVKLSIIIVNYNTKTLLRQCLDSLMENGKPASRQGRWQVANSEIIVVDNGSTDGSTDMVKKRFPRVKLTKNKKNLGYAKANNQAIEKSKGKYILFLNSDTVVPRETIPKLLVYLENNPSVGVVTPKLKLRGGRLDPDCHRGFPTPWAAFCYFTGLEKIFKKRKLFGQYHQTWKNLNKIHEIDACCGAFLLTRKKILEEVGVFDESYFFYGEDLDLCYRIKQKDWKIIYYPRVMAIHYKGASSNLRKETRGVAQLSRPVRIKIAKASALAMGIFYDKFYKDRYPFLVNLLVKSGIKVKENARILSAKLG
jgi:GT2 family glycosyltransferase